MSLSWSPQSAGLQPVRRGSSLPQRLEIGLLHGVPMLKPLPVPAIEQLARRLEPVQVPAGQAVFRQSDPGDRFYVIETGAAYVVEGRLVTTLGPGDGFGEIGLLRRVPCTATVRAATELQALKCDRSASCHRVPAECAGGRGRGRGYARPIQPG